MSYVIFDLAVPSDTSVLLPAYDTVKITEKFVTRLSFWHF